MIKRLTQDTQPAETSNTGLGLLPLSMSHHEKGSRNRSPETGVPSVFHTSPSSCFFCQHSLILFLRLFFWGNKCPLVASLSTTLMLNGRKSQPFLKRIGTPANSLIALGRKFSLPSLRGEKGRGLMVSQRPFLILLPSG